MRLLYLSGDPGVPVRGDKGASVHLRSMAGALAGLGHDVLVASPRCEPGENPLPQGVRCEEIAAVKPRDHGSAEGVLASAELQARDVLELAARERVEAIYERYSLATFAGARAATKLGIPLAVEVNAPLREEAKRFRVLAHERAAIAAELETFAAARRLFAVSPPIAGWLENQPGSSGRIEVMRNAPPQREFAPKPPISAGREVVVGFTGGLKPWHGIDTLLRAVALALGRGARIRLEVLGTGPMEGLVSKAARTEPRIAPLGHLPHEQALDVLERWDVGLAPFDAVEGFYFSPLKVLEYMAAGLCPVASDIGELGEMVDHGRAGVLVPPGDAEALAHALVELDQDRDHVRALAAHAQRQVHTWPTWTDNARRVLAAIAEPITAEARR
jgi:glycosyltransferase involved in cell wall biosynthesis